MEHTKRWRYEYENGAYQLLMYDGWSGLFVLSLDNGHKDWHSYFDGPNYWPDSSEDHWRSLGEDQVLW